MPLSENKKTPRKHDAMEALQTHIKGLTRSIKMKDMQIHNMEKQLAKTMEELSQLRETMASKPNAALEMNE